MKKKNWKKYGKQVRKTRKKRQETRLRMRTHEGTLSGSRGHVTSGYDPPQILTENLLYTTLVILSFIVN
jgi:hypothetical protein